jgi:uncharacterized membrane protein YciS (DUF1049 family)
LDGGAAAGSWGGASRKVHPLQRVGFAGTMKKLPPTVPTRRTVMNRSTRDAVAFGLGFLTGALLLAMLMGLQVRVAQARAEEFRAEAEAERQQTIAARMIAEQQASMAQQALVQVQALRRAAEKKD